MQLLTPKDLSKLLKISLPMTYKMAKEGKLPFVTIGKSIRFREDDVFKYIEGNTYQDYEIRIPYKRKQIGL